MADMIPLTGLVARAIAPQGMWHGHVISPRPWDSVGPLELKKNQKKGTVVPTMTYGAETWTLTEPLKQQLRRTQRRMVRIIIGTPRRRTAAPMPRHDPAADQYNDHHGTGNAGPRDANASNDSTDSDVRSDPPTDQPDLQDTGSDDVDAQPGSRREDDLELWSDFIRRSTRRAEALMLQHDIPDVLHIPRRMA